VPDFVSSVMKRVELGKKFVTSADEVVGLMKGLSV
jgi:hypothetical protein